MSPINDEDLDRLADHAAGLLDPSEEARVARLVATDPAWAQAYAALVAAQPRLDEALAGLGNAVPVPVDIADRLDAALAAQRPPEPRTATVVNLESRRRWRRLAWATAAVAAAVVAVFGGVTVVSSLGGSGISSSTSSGADTAAGTRPQAAAPFDSAASPPPVLHSGTDYTPATLASAGGKAAPGPAAAGRPPGAQADQGNRVDDSTDLSACLGALVARYGGRPTLVDYARYEGQPAVIVVLTSGSVRRVVAAGPTCGLPGAGTAELYSVTE